MAPAPPKGPPAPSWFQVQNTSSGEPFVALPVKDPSTPIFLTLLYGSDASSMSEILTHPAVNSALISLPCPYTLDDAHSRIDFVRQKDERMFHHAIRAGHPETGPFIGCISFSSMSESSSDDKGFELGYHISPAFHRKGIMREAVPASLIWAAENGVRDVLVRAAEDNLGSRAIVEGLDGFERLDGREEVAWPESKGGGTKVLLSWRRVI
ncbi:MAG: hypothetical protein M1818_002435 [Claussenomyces sp. TS43310]|nr:MAG: hypothetical protein M1818_002435 [Claussenomyces sp. TS43310]